MRHEFGLADIPSMVKRLATPGNSIFLGCSLVVCDDQSPQEYVDYSPLFHEIPLIKTYLSQALSSAA